MLSNLKAEMARYEVSRSDIAHEIGKSMKAVNEKVGGKSQFTMAEALKIRNRFFPTMALEYLFSDQVEAG